MDVMEKKKKKNKKKKKKITFCVFIGHKRHNPFGHLYFHYESPSIKCCCCQFLVNVFTKGLFLTSTTPTLPNFNGGNCSAVGS